MSTMGFRTAGLALAIGLLTSVHAAAQPPEAPIINRPLNDTKEDLKIVASVTANRSKTEIEETFSVAVGAMGATVEGEIVAEPIPSTVVELLPALFEIGHQASPGPLSRNYRASREYFLKYDPLKTPKEFVTQVKADNSLVRLPWSGKNDGQFRKTEMVGVAAVTAPENATPISYGVSYVEDGDKAPAMLPWPSETRYYMVTLPGFRKEGVDSPEANAKELIETLGDKEKTVQPILDARAQVARMVMIDFDQLIPATGGEWISGTQFKVSLPKLPGLSTARVLAVFPLTQSERDDLLKRLDSEGPENIFEWPEFVRDELNLGIIDEASPDVLAPGPQQYLLEIPLEQPLGNEADAIVANFTRTFAIEGVQGWKEKFAGQKAYMVYMYEFDNGMTRSIQRVRKSDGSPGSAQSEAEYLDIEMPSWPAGFMEK